MSSLSLAPGHSQLFLDIQLACLTYVYQPRITYTALFFQRAQTLISSPAAFKYPRYSSGPFNEAKSNE